MWPFRKKCKHPQTRILTHKHGVALKCVDCGETIDALPFREVNEFLENGLLQVLKTQLRLAEEITASQED